jgi:hypothetical protein
VNEPAGQFESFHAVTFPSRAATSARTILSPCEKARDRWVLCAPANGGLSAQVSAEKPILSPWASRLTVTASCHSATVWAAAGAPSGRRDKAAIHYPRRPDERPINFKPSHVRPQTLFYGIVTAQARSYEYVAVAEAPTAELKPAAPFEEHASSDLAALPAVPAARVSPAGILLDRGWGRAAQVGEDGGPIKVIIRQIVDIAGEAEPLLIEHEPLRKSK